MAFGRKNVIKIDPLQYNIGLIGESGIGKTTIIKEMCEKLAGEEGYLFVECGKEDGADAISGINYINCPSWTQDYDEYSNSVGFDELVEDILDNKESEYKNLKTLVIDTIDQLIDIAKPEVIRLHNREFPDKPVKSIKAAFGGYMAGEDKAIEIVLEKLWSLKTVGVHFIVIGHVKQKEQEDIATGKKFTSLTTNMSLRDFNAIKTKLHFLGVASIDREIVMEKTGNKDVKGKDITRGVIASESRKITFRDDSYSIDSKSRFADIVPEIKFDCDELIQALTDAIKKEQAKSGRSLEDVKKEQEEADAKKKAEVAEAEQAKKEQKEIEEIMAPVIEFIRANKSKAAKIKPLIEKAKEYGTTPLAVTDMTLAKELSAMIEGK